MSDPLERLARRVEGDPFFLASVLVEYAHGEGLDDAGLALELGCRAGDLTALRLCRAPRPAPADFRADVQEVASRFALDPTRLMDLVRHGEALRRLREGAAGAAGFLMAARDRPEAPASDEGTEGP
jgi:hypothetical protein